MSTDTEAKVDEREVYISADHLDPAFARYLAAQLRDHGFRSEYGSDLVRHKVALMEDGTERHQVTISTSGAGQAADALRIVASRWDHQIIDGQTADDLMKLVYATTEDAQDISGAGEARKFFTGMGSEFLLLLLLIGFVVGAVTAISSLLK